MILSQKIISQFILIIFFLQVITPAALAQAPVMQEDFDPNAYYDIVSNSSIYNSVPGSKLSWVGEELQILLGGGSIILAKKNIEQVRQIGADYVPVSPATAGTSGKKSKRNTLLGLGIGAGAGAAIGIGVGFAIASIDDDDCGSQEDGCVLNYAGGAAGAGIFITSTIIGVVVGALTKKKEKGE